MRQRVGTRFEFAIAGSQTRPPHQLYQRQNQRLKTWKVMGSELSPYHTPSHCVSSLACRIILSLGSPTAAECERSDVMKERGFKPRDACTAPRREHAQLVLPW